MLTTSAPPATTIDLDLLNSIAAIEAISISAFNLSSLKPKVIPSNLHPMWLVLTLNAEKIEPVGANLSKLAQLAIALAHRKNQERLVL